MLESFVSDTDNGKQMSSQAFFWVNVGLGLLLAVIFLFWKKRLATRKITRSVETASHSKPTTRPVFIYNGHNFDAFEVFGLPPDSSLEKVEQAFRTACQKNGHDQLFLETALQAIQGSHRK